MNIRVFYLISACQFAFVGASAQISVEFATSAQTCQPIHISAPANTGLDQGIYVVPDLTDLRIRYATSMPSAVKWYTFSSMGAAYAEELTPAGVDSGSSWIIPASGDLGYVVEDGGRSHYIWLIDYSAHRFISGSVSPGESSCDMTDLNTTAKADDISYYGINGRRFTLGREISLGYTTLDWSDDSETFIDQKRSVTLDYISPTLHVPSSFCDTRYTIEGDRFLRAWGREISIESPDIQPIAVLAHTSAVQHNLTSDNEITSSTPGALGGSAPCDITFSAVVSDAAIFHEWQVARTADFEDVMMRAPELDFSHTFSDQGTTYVRLYCANADASCEYWSETYEIVIGESMLKCPNAFTPFNQDGVNDVWRVTFSSLVEFECHIYNRNGHEIYSFTDPAGGWDGRYGGKFVPTGAYYYVIKALGGDGKKYKLAGDINILEYK